MISEDLRFTTQMQYVHKFQNRWGPSVERFEMIRAHMEAQGQKMDPVPLVSVHDLPEGSFLQRLQWYFTPYFYVNVVQFLSKGQWTYGPTLCLSIDTHIFSKGNKVCFM